MKCAFPNALRMAKYITECKNYLAETQKAFPRAPFRIGNPPF